MVPYGLLMFWGTNHHHNFAKRPQKKNKTIKKSYSSNPNRQTHSAFGQAYRRAFDNFDLQKVAARETQDNGSWLFLAWIPTFNFLLLLSLVVEAAAVVVVVFVFVSVVVVFVFVVFFVVFFVVTFFVVFVVVVVAVLVVFLLLLFFFSYCCRCVAASVLCVLPWQLVHRHNVNR